MNIKCRWRYWWKCLRRADAAVVDVLFFSLFFGKIIIDLELIRIVWYGIYCSHWGNKLLSLCTGMNSHNKQKNEERTHFHDSYFKMNTPSNPCVWIVVFISILSDSMIDCQWSLYYCAKIYIENYHLLLIKHLRMLAINKTFYTMCVYAFCFTI